MKEIPLTQGKTAVVDDDMYDFLNQWKWCAIRQGKNWYAVRNGPPINGHRLLIRMHRLIKNTPKDMDTHHISGNTLDNRDRNLQVCTTAENLNFWREFYYGGRYCKA